MNNEQNNYHLRLPRDEMRALGYRVIDILVEHFDELPQKPVTRIAERAEMERRLREPLPDEAREVMSVLSQLQAEVFSHIMHVDHPRFFAGARESLVERNFPHLAGIFERDQSRRGRGQLL